MKVNKYMLFLYHYNSNNILIQPLKNRSDEETLKVCTEMYDTLAAHNCVLILHVLDNEASCALKRIITKKWS